MCGIFLHYKRESDDNDLIKDYRAISGSIAHRGPDAMGVAAIPNFHQNRIANVAKIQKTEENFKFCPVSSDFFHGTGGFIGHQRLSIIDTSASSIQPFIDKSSQVALSFNGEVYNYIELREELKSAGHNFDTTSDTEVVLKAYLEWDTQCFERFNGDYAILFYDHRKKSIIVCRDRMGVKPLYFYKTSRSITFSSELKSFINFSGYTPELDEELAYLYLVADFPTEKTLDRSFLKGIESVPTAHWYQIDLQNFNTRFNRYWRIEDKKRPLIDINEASAEFDHIFSNAVKIRLRSDVPVGSFLSGGLDSPSIVWHTVNQNYKLPTFSSIFSEKRVDETEKINNLSKLFKVKNYQQPVDFNNFVEDISTLVYLQDEPFSTLNVYTQYQNFIQAKNHQIKVMLDGGGADEFLAGYSDFALLAAVDSQNTKDLSEKNIPRYQQFLKADICELRQWCSEHEKEKRTVKYINPDLRKIFRGDKNSVDRPLPDNYKRQFAGSYLLNGLVHATLDSWMNKSIHWDNRYLDRTGMWMGIEARVPFQDHRLVDFIFTLPPDFIYHDGFSKYILRKSMQNRIPDDIMFEKEKIGFEFPFCDLLRKNKTFQNFFEDLMNEKKFKEFDIFQSKFVVEDYNKILDGQNNNYNLWRVFNLYIWCQHFVYNN